MSLPASPRTQRANTYDLSGRVALVTGGLGALGAAVSLGFARAGAQVVISGSQERTAELEKLRQALGERAEAITFLPANAQDEASVEVLVRGVVDRHGHLDVLANTVGGYAAGQAVTHLDVATWERMLDLNLRTAFLLAKHAVPPMVHQGWGRILHVSSRAARSGRRNAAAYAIAKSGVLSLTEIQAEELHDTGVTVNAILPSIIDTSSNRASMPSADYSRWPTPDEVARVLLFLASDDASLISGATIPVYGRA